MRRSVGEADNDVVYVIAANDVSSAAVVRRWVIEDHSHSDDRHDSVPPCHPEVRSDVHVRNTRRCRRVPAILLSDFVKAGSASRRGRSDRAVVFRRHKRVRGAGEVLLGARQVLNLELGADSLRPCVREPHPRRHRTGGFALSLATARPGRTGSISVAAVISVGDVVVVVAAVAAAIVVVHVVHAHTVVGAGRTPHALTTPAAPMSLVGIHVLGRVTTLRTRGAALSVGYIARRAFRIVAIRRT
mmetsp:Transcript_3748/g.13872  ORF Transcript_3748/g.13872 Transcript_3748/m.13872 type:complete len:244 (+) Transcript_3748:1799-2530(+)